MLHQHERWILYYETVLKSHPEGAPFIPIIKTIPYIEELWRAQDAFHLIDNGNAAVRLRDMRLDEENGILQLLINYADKRVSDPVFENLASGQLRSEPKLDGEGVAVSAHLLISMRNTAPDRPLYRTLLEDVPGIGRTKLRPFLTHILKKSTNFVFTDVDEVEKRCRPIVEMDGYMGETLRSDLAEGMLSGVELISYENPEKEFDEEGHLVTKSRRLVLNVEKGLDRATALELLNRVRRKARKSGFSEMLVRYNRNEGRQKSIKFGTAREDAGDALVMRSDVINVEDPLLQCEDKLRNEVVGQMTELLVADRNRRGG
ncbi:MAG TPA: hypothetical protein VGN05_08745 [Parvibaculum sp.]|jgi:hypothetical protein